MRSERIALTCDLEQVAAARDKAQRDEAPFFIGRHTDRTAGLQSVQRTRRSVDTQECQCNGIIDRSACQQAADRIAALHTLLAPEHAGFAVLGKRRRCGQRAHDAMRNDRFERRLGRESECGYAGEPQRGKRERLPRERQRVVHRTPHGRRDPLR